MIFESVSIIILLLVVSIIFARTKKYGYVGSTLALSSVPSMNIIIHFLNQTVTTVKYTDNKLLVYVVAMVAALALCCLLLGIFSGNIKFKSNRAIFLVMGGGFEVLLTIIYINNVISIMPK